MSRYVASIYLKWEDFTDRHKMIREEVEEKVNRFLKGEKPNPIAIRGPIGQGKTQLLYHIFTFVWKNGGIAFYTTLDQLLPDKEITASVFANEIDFKINDCIKKLTTGEIDKIPFLTEEMKIFVKNLSGNISRQSRAVFLIDEMERSYEKLLSKVKTDDRSPLGYWLEHTLHFPIAAFAPLSHYEALYGEAERRRWDTITLPPISAHTLRQKAGDMGNFVWWISRGRLGISYKAIDSIKRKALTEYKDFKDLVDELGPIAGVPSIDLHVIAELSKTYNLVVNIFPHQGEISLPNVVKGDIVDKSMFLEIVKNSLIKEGWEKRIVELFMYYFKMIVEAVSKDDDFLVPDEYDKLLSLFKLGIDLAIEHETLENEDVKKISEKFSELKSEGKFAQFFYTKIYGEIQKFKKARGSILSYTMLSDIFPMPITSPLFGGIEDINKAKEIMLSKAPYNYIAKDEIDVSEGNIVFLYFPNEDKLEKYLNSAEIKDFLPPNKGLICILLSGSPESITLSGIAKWLKDVKRFKIEVPSKMLCDFLMYFTAWALENVVIEGYINNLRDFLRKQAEELSVKDKESSRKILHYKSMLETFLNSFIGYLELKRDKYLAKSSRDLTVRHGERYSRFPDIIGVSFIKSRDALNLIYRFRKLLMDSEELKKLRSGIGGLLEDASVTRSGLSSTLENIREDFENELPHLLALAHVQEIQEDDFTRLSEQREAKTILRGIFKYARSEISPSQIEKIKEEIEEVLREIEKLMQEREKIVEIMGLNIRESKSEKNLSQIRELNRIISDMSTIDSQYLKWLLSEFSATILKDFREEYLHPDQTILSKWQMKSNIAKKFELSKNNIEKISAEVFEWIEKSKQDVISELESGYKDALKALIRYEQQVAYENVDGLEWSTFEEKVENLINHIRNLQELDSEIRKVLNIANRINTRLKVIQNEVI